MPVHSRFRPLTGVLAAAALLMTAALVGAAEPLNGYRSAEFGMSSEQVRERMEDDGVIGTTAHETADGDLVIDARLDDGEDPETGVRYVFPGGRDRLALVLEFHPDPAAAGQVRNRLRERHGAPWADDLAAKWFDQLKEDMPDGVQELTVWGGGEGNRDRFIRLWVFDDYLSVEYLDLNLLSATR